MNLSDRRVLVTGAASGIGRATVARLVAGGARVAGFDVAASDASGHDGLRHWRVDVSDETSVSAAVPDAVAWLGGLDVLVHVAGIMGAQRVPIDEVPVEVWDQVIAVNLRGTFLMSKHVIPQFAPGTGALVLVSSVAGVFFASGSFPTAPARAACTASR